MSVTTGVAELEKALDAVLAHLLSDTGASRTTLRIDDPGRGWHVDFVCAEAVRRGVKPLRGDGSIDQRAAATVKWMVNEKRQLIQPDLTNDPDPAPPPGLMSAYAVKAQMLAPLFNRQGYLQGWISVHYVDGAREFTPADLAALNHAQAEVKRMTGVGA
jgi:GAF domain-containing protein